MPYRVLFFALVSISFTAAAQVSKNSYHYTIDLTKVVDDRLLVELKTPASKPYQVFNVILI